MLAGLKPVYVSGRGFDEEGWHSAVLELAASNGLYVVAGPYWEPERPPTDLPDWFVERVRKGLDEGRAHYVTKARAAADEIKTLAAGGRPTMEQEARLLGFPLCCVEAHYATAAAFENATFEILSRRAGGDETEMKRLAEGPEPVVPETDEERAMLAMAVSVQTRASIPASTCARNAPPIPPAPGARLSASYGELIDTLAGKRRRDPVPHGAGVERVPREWEHCTAVVGYAFGPDPLPDPGAPA